MNEQALSVGAADNTGEESEVLSDAARSLEELARRLPASSRWTDVLESVAEAFETGARLSEMRHHGRAA